MTNSQHTNIMLKKCNNRYIKSTLATLNYNMKSNTNDLILN